MEVHLVHFNTKYGTDLGSAIAGGKGASDTLAVLGAMFQLVNKNNDKIDPIINGEIKYIFVDKIQNFRSLHSQRSKFLFFLYCVTNRDLHFNVRIESLAMT